MNKFIKRQWSSAVQEWQRKQTLKHRAKLIYQAIFIWFVIAPLIYITFFLYGLLTLQNPHKIAVEGLNEVM